MTKNEIITKIEALNEWEALMEEAKAEVEALRDSIKAEMMERDTEELTAGLKPSAIPLKRKCLNATPRN